MPSGSHLFIATATFILSGTLTAPKVAAQSSLDLRYDSPLGTYRKWQEQPVQSWREANDTVGKIGGWRTYASEPDVSGGAAKVPAGEHAGHGGKPAEGVRK